MKDGWQHFYTYILSGDTQAYASAPSVATAPSTAASLCGTTTNFNDDIIYSNGTFLQWPEGTQN